MTHWLRRQAQVPPQLREPLFDVRPLGALPGVLGATRFYGVGDDHPDGLRARMHELPPPAERRDAAVLAEDDSLAIEAQNVLRAQGYREIHVIKVPQLHETTPQLVTEWPEPLSRALWKPSPALVSVLPGVFEHFRSTLPHQSLTALDIGAGSGRDAAYLAANGWHVTTVDRDENLVEKAVVLGNRRDQQLSGLSPCTVSERRGGVKGVVRTLGADLSDDARWLRQHAAHFVVVVRFLRRGVLERIHQGILPGGFLFYEHFLTGCEAYGGPMKRSQMLERGELEVIFGPQKGFHVCQSNESKLDDGRPVVRFLARKVVDFR